MKRTILYAFILLITYACTKNKDANQVADTGAKAESNLDSLNKKIASDSALLEHYRKSLEGEFKNFQVYNLTDTIKVDLNGDTIEDMAFFTNNKNISITDGATKKVTIVGSDKSFGDMGNDFSWADFWGITTDKETFEVVVKDDEIVGDRGAQLANHSLFVRKDEVGGGVITFKAGKYIWVHQAD